MSPVMRDGDAVVYQCDTGKVVVIEGEKRTEYRNAEECARDLQKRRSL